MCAPFLPGLQAVQEAASRLVSSLLVGLSNYYPVGQYDPGEPLLDGATAQQGQQGQVAEAYVDKFGHGGLPLSWHVPTEGEVRPALPQ